METKILYVEDDLTLSFLTKDSIELKGYQVDHAAEGQAALDKFKDGTYDLCIFDVMLPKMDGFTLANEVRKINKQVPIIFLTAKSLKEDRIEGLSLGADDYITKPFSIEELLLKIEIFLRRKFIVPNENRNIHTIGNYEFDANNLQLKHGESSQKLTQKETELLDFLLKNPNIVLKRGEILERVWGKNDYFLGRSMDVFISRLRKYLKQDPRIKILNIHGHGFKFVVDQQ